MLYLLEPNIHIKGDWFPWITDDRKGIFLVGRSSTWDTFHSKSTTMVSYLAKEIPQN